MSRIGRAPILIPDGVTVNVDEDNLVLVNGPLGALSRKISHDITINIADGVLTVARPSDDTHHRSLHGLSRTIIYNMVVGVTVGFTKNLEIAGVGYRAAKQGNNLNLSLGYSHPVIIEPPDGITLDAPTPTSITVHGIDLEIVSIVNAAIKSWRDRSLQWQMHQIRRQKCSSQGR